MYSNNKKRKRTDFLSINKKLCWNIIYGDSITESKCPICYNNIIYQNNFNYMISDKDNLIPLCDKCNSNVSKYDIGEYAFKYYPNSYNRISSIIHIINTYFSI
jgi:hypothetical protein